MWKKLNDNYKVSSSGKVMNIKTGKILKANINSKGYERISIYGKRYFVHRLVAKLFKENNHNLPQVNHINHNKLDNRASNLEWCDNSYNNLHSFTSGRMPGNVKLTTEEVNQILNHLKENKLSIKELASIYNVSIQTIYAIRKGRNIKRCI